MSMEYQRALILYRNRSGEARELAQALADRLGTVHPIWPVDDVTQLQLSDGPDIVVTVGGDGTILRAVQLAAPLGVPLLGVNMGRLGFLTEVEASRALEMVPQYLEAGYPWTEKRNMLQAVVDPLQGSPPPSAPVHALNEVVVGRGSAARLVHIRVAIDGAELGTYKADAVIVATATGSTGYALSAGGPILYPTSADLLLQAVAPQSGSSTAVIVSVGSLVELTVVTDRPVSLSADGFQDLPLQEGDTVRISPSPYVACFLRAGPPASFYERLAYRLLRGENQESSHLSRFVRPEETKRHA